MIVAIDGPAGAGKSTVARALARRLGMGYLNTGAMYRAIAWLALREGVSPVDGPRLAALARDHPVRLAPSPEGERVFVGDLEATARLREAAVNDAVSEVSAHPEVRREVVAAQRALLAKGDWVADGRDVGSVVWPAAELKVFLTARPEVRARRRRAELADAGRDALFEDVLAAIERRDHRDRTRAESPLIVAEGAVELDSSALDVDQVVGQLERRLAELAGGRR